MRISFLPIWALVAMIAAVVDRMLNAVAVARGSTNLDISAGADVNLSGEVLCERVDTGPGDNRADARVEVIENDMNDGDRRRGPGLKAPMTAARNALTAIMLTAAGLAQRRAAGRSSLSFA